MSSSSNQITPEFQAILNIIEHADDDQIQLIMHAVRKRYQILFPDWEVLYLSCPKNDQVAKQRILDFLTRHCQI